MPSRRRRPGSDSDRKLETYRRKRDFVRTPEPAGARPSEPADAELQFVVQRHRARRLHYDFRLEIGGVLVSWAVPKGPTLDPKVRRGAFRTEDHPIEYLHFEGVIPSREYGGGDVIVWDTGKWQSGKGDAARDLARGELHVDLFGEKLRGRFVLVRTSPPDEDKQEWLLLHKRDEFASPGWDSEDHPKSVLSGRTNDEVKADPDRMWRSDLPAASASILLKPADVTGAELAELDSFQAAGTWHVFGRELRVTNLDKPLFPGRGRGKPITKRQLLRYAARIAPTLLPYLAGRALNMHRFPNGATTKGFWQKELPDHAPEWLTRWTNPDAKPDDTQVYLVAEEPAALVWAANFGALEWHAWTSKIEQSHAPTYALIDIDPGESTRWIDVLDLARLHRTALDHLGVLARPKITGRRGVQIWIPIAAGPSFDETRTWVEELSHTVGAVVPDLVSWKWQVRDRGGLARLDYTQNAINKTLVAPYSPRAAPGAPVSTPIDWDELDDRRLRPDRWTIETVLDRLAERGDPFRVLLDSEQRLPSFE